MSQIQFWSILALTACTLLSASAQSDYLTYTWAEEPSFEIPVEYADESEVIVMDRNGVEFVLEDNTFYQYELSHIVTYVQDDAAVENNNKVFLSTRQEDEVLFQKVRVINRQGEIREFDESDIKEGFDEQSGLNYEYFAVEGLDKGSFVEWLYIIKSNARYNGSMIRLGAFETKLQTSFELIAPEHLLFEFASYNGLPDVKLDTVHNEKNYYRLAVDVIPAMENELMSYPAANLAAIAYKLDENTAANSVNMSSYKPSIRNFYAYVYQMLSKADRKALSRVIKDAGIQDQMSDREKIIQLENYIKGQFAVLPYAQAEFETIEAVVNNKASTDNGYIRLYANAFDLMGIKHELVLTSDRTMYAFDPDFEAVFYLQSAQIYLSDLDQYLSPESTHLRLGYIPWEFTDNYGLFISRFDLGDLSTGVGRIDKIEAPGHESSQLNHGIVVDMREDVLEPTCHFKVEMSGHMSSFIQTGYESLSTSEREMMDFALKDFITAQADDMELKISNAEADVFGRKPLVVEATVTTSDFTTRAGNKVLLKLGNLIGEQTEMYNEKPRTLRIDNDFNRSFYRTITVHVPQDYTITNLDQLNVNIEMPDGTARFFSDYTFEENTLVLSIDEYYDRIQYPKEDFEDFKEVINEAADFNKVVLFLEKQ